MLGESEAIIIIEGSTAIILLISVILIYLTIKSNRDLHKQILLNDLVTEERNLKIKLNEYYEKINRTKSNKRKDEIWNDYDTLLFSYYEYAAIIIIKKMIKESDAKTYFKPLLVDVYEVFYHDSEIFDEEEGPFRKDYPYLRLLLRKWDMKSLCDSLFRKST